MSSTSAYDGLQEQILRLKTPTIEVFENIYSDRPYLIDFEIPEFTAVCPKTNLPDFGTVFISYQPQASCIELKSLKEYFLFYRNLGIFQENVANRTLDDLVKACQPAEMQVRVRYNVRGGITTVVTTSYTRK